MTALTPSELDILRHSLGWPKMYRNYFVTGPGTTDYPIIQMLIAKGLMLSRGPESLYGGDEVFHVTEAGRAVVEGESR